MVSQSGVLQQICEPITVHFPFIQSYKSKSSSCFVEGDDEVSQSLPNIKSENNKSTPKRNQECANNSYDNLPVAADDKEKIPGSE